MAGNSFIDTCCVKSFAWDGVPQGTESTLADLPCYVTGTNREAAVLYVHDILGWKFPNARILADHFAREVRFALSKHACLIRATDPSPRPM